MMWLVAGAAAIGSAAACAAAAIHGDYWWALGFGIFSALSGSVKVTTTNTDAKVKP